jgi:diaminohydroxyphosphoribosylaminopyrimidine deaminase/5-amino-6-(5-phosphoribosylamino)uracil reductase
VLVEAGPRLAAACLAAGVVDELWWLHAPIVVGGDGLSALETQGLDDINAAARFDVVTRAPVGDDTLTVFRPPPRQRPTLSASPG